MKTGTRIPSTHLPGPDHQNLARFARQNNPIFVKNLGGPENELRYHFISHVSCDIIEERSEIRARWAWRGVLCDW
ncbi:hypothetical protein M427DRAFT_100785 [Gonapodya prolifera JEL478]|uniref:Uncharacterized protein n=1 Tax=Gonapodya prolifera (strain JEL478) TaxID=1344416 RepID=A0A139A8N4_GONPJ|nr:hypothetical protein M427DRAFT_100785 [Gonapodya prolifera JEL478]|eukprot:KXS13140.1 hypothetical protein M427DRAFT_100785 [Gonapodya prolifera JEL478]